MIKTKSVKAVIMAVTILSLVVALYGDTVLALKGNRYVSESKFVAIENVDNSKPVKSTKKEDKVSNTDNTLKIEVEPVVVAEGTSEEELQKEALEAKLDEVVFEGMTLRELSNKLDRSLNDTLSGQGYTFASWLRN